jgi:RNA polymerase sigma factor (TIGR02999 family)
MGRAGGNHTLQPTALVHEAWLKIARGRQAPWDDQEHLLATAARAMRHALVDHARAKAAARRGGDRQRVEMPAVDDRCACQRVLELNDALQALAEVDPQLARLVELRAFGGLSIEEVARALAISPRSVKRGWAVAQSWLRCKLADDHGRAH